MGRSLAEQAAEMKARRLAQRAERRAVRKTVHAEIVESLRRRSPYLNTEGFSKELRRLWDSQTKYHQRRLHRFAETSLKTVNSISVIPDLWGTTYLEDGIAELDIFEVVVSHDIDVQKAFFYNELSELGLMCDPVVNVYVTRVDRFGICIRYDPEHLYFEVARLYS